MVGRIVAVWKSDWYDPTTTTGEPQGVCAPATLPAGMAATYTAQVARESTEEARLLATPTPDPVLNPVAQGQLLRTVWTSSHTATEEKPVLLYSSRNSWNTLTLADNGTREPYTVTLPVTNAAIILSFLATFDAHDHNAETTRFLIDNVQVRSGAFDCVPPGPCQ